MGDGNRKGKMLLYIAHVLVVSQAFGAVQVFYPFFKDVVCGSPVTTWSLSQIP